MNQALIVSHFNGLVLTAAQIYVDGSPVITTRLNLDYTPQQTWYLRDDQVICLASYQSSVLAIAQGDPPRLTISTSAGAGDAAARWRLTDEGYLIQPGSGLMVVLAPGDDPDRVALALSASLPAERDMARWLLGAPINLSSLSDGAQIGIVRQGAQPPALAAYRPLMQLPPPLKTWVHTPDGYLINLESSLFLTALPGADGSPAGVAALPRMGDASQQWTAIPDGPIFPRGAVTPGAPIPALTAQPSSPAAASLALQQHTLDADLPPEARWAQSPAWPSPTAEPRGAPSAASDFKWERPLEGQLIDWCRTDTLLCTLTVSPDGAAAIRSYALGTGEPVQTIALPLPPEILRMPMPREGVFPGRPINPSQPRVLAPAWGQLALALAPADLAARPQIVLADPASGALATLATLPAAGMLLWMAAAEDTLYIFTDPEVYALTRDGQLTGVGSLSPWIDGLHNTSGAPPALFTGLVQGGIVYLAGASQFGGFSVSQGSVSAWRFDSGLGRLLWSTGTAVMAGPADDQISALVADGATLYWSTGREVRAVDLVDGSDRWKVTAGEGELFIGLALDAGSAYVTERDTGVRAYACASGQLRATLAFRETPLARPLVADGVLYTFSPNYVYAADLTYSDEALEVPMSVTALLAADSDTVYMADENSIYAQDFMEVIREFSVDSVLIQDFVALDPAQPQALSRVPVYHVAITLFDDARMPRGNEPVKIWALEQATIAANGTSYSVGATTAVTIETGPDGRLIIEVPAEGITAPPLLLWAPFMPANEQIVIYPDHGVHASLGALTGDDLGGARDYDGNPIFDQAYQGGADPAAQARGAVASAVSALATVVNNARQAPADATPTPTRYLAPDAPRKGAHHLPRLSQLAVALASPASWILDLTPGAALFRHLTADEVRLWKQQHPAAAGQGDDLWAALKSGAATLLHAVVDATEGLGVIVTTISAGVETVYHAVIDGVEKAATLIGAFFQKLGATTKKALEWLSYIFDWQSILATHAQIVTTITGSLGLIVSSGYLEALQGQLDAIFEQWKGDAGAMFNRARAALGEESFNSYPSAQPGHPLVDGARAQTSGAREGWLTHKVVHHNLSAGGPARSGSDPFLTPMEVAAEAFWGTLESAVSADVQEKLAQFTSGFARMSPSTFLQGSLATLLTGAELVLDVVIDFAEAVISGVFSLFKELVVNNLLLDGLQQEINLPFITDFYRYITRTPATPQGSPMTILDMFALLVAIPTSALTKIWGELHPEPEGSADLLGGGGQAPFPQWCTLAAAATTILYARIDFFLELKGEELPRHIQGIFGVGMPAVILALQMADVIRTFTGNIEANALINLPALCTMALDLCALRFTDKQQLARYSDATQWISSVLGFVNAVVILSWTINQPALRAWPNITANALSTIMMLIKPVRQVKGEPPLTGVAIVAVVDSVLTLGVAVMGFVSAIPTLPSGHPDESGGATKRDQAPTAPALLGAPAAAPYVSPRNPASPFPQPGRSIGSVRYAYRFYTESWESPASPWSLPFGIAGAGQVVEVHLGVEPQGLATGRRVYRQLSGGATELVAQIADNTTTTFSDTPA